MLDADQDAASALGRDKAVGGPKHPTGQMSPLLRDRTGSPEATLGLFNCTAAVLGHFTPWAVSSAILSSVELLQQR